MCSTSRNEPPRAAIRAAGDARNSRRFISSKQQFQSKLNLPRRGRSGDHSEIARVLRRVRIAEVHAIEQVEKLRPELQSGPFANPEALEHREIERGIPRPVEYVPSEIA